MKKILLVLMSVILLFSMSCSNIEKETKVETFNYSVVDEIIPNQLFLEKYETEIIKIVDNSEICDDEKSYIKEVSKKKWEVEKVYSTSSTKYDEYKSGLQTIKLELYDLHTTYKTNTETFVPANK